MWELSYLFAIASFKQVRPNHLNRLQYASTKTNCLLILNESKPDLKKQSVQQQQNILFMQLYAMLMIEHFPLALQDIL